MSKVLARFRISRRKPASTLASADGLTLIAGTLIHLVGCHSEGAVFTVVVTGLDPDIEQGLQLGSRPRQLEELFRSIWLALFLLLLGEILSRLDHLAVRHVLSDIGGQQFDEVS